MTVEVGMPYPWDDPTSENESTPGPRIRAEVFVYPDTKMGLHDFESGCALVIGHLLHGNLVITLGYDEETRRDACDRLIATLTEARDWTPKT